MRPDGRYERDMRGYGANPPDAKWPGGAHVAVQFVINYEEGGENCLLHGDAQSEAFLSEIVGAQNWPDIDGLAKNVFDKPNALETKCIIVGLTPEPQHPLMPLRNVLNVAMDANQLTLAVGSYERGRINDIRQHNGMPNREPCSGPLSPRRVAGDLI